MSAEDIVHGIEDLCIPLSAANAISIQSLPQEALEMIMSHLKYSEVCHIGILCKGFRRAAVSLQCSALRNLVPQILKYISELQSAVKDDTFTLQEHLQNAFLQTVLLILLGEARMFSATYLRYLQHEPYVNVYPGGSLLDEFYYMLDMTHSRQISRELEPELSTRLLTKAEKFYEMFEDIVEPTLIQLHTPVVVTPLCVKLMDALDCCQTSNFRVSVTHDSGKAPFHISGYYELRDFNTLESPPKISDDLCNESKMRVVLHYIRSTVRWNNIFHPLKALWEIDEKAVRSAVPKEVATQAFMAYRHRCNIVISQLFPSDLVANDKCYGIQQGSAGAGPCRQEFIREISDLLGHSPAYGLTCNIKMHITDSKYLPTEYEFLIEPSITNHCSSSSRTGILQENIYRTKYPSASSSISIIVPPYYPMLNTDSSSRISLTLKDTLSRVSEVLANAIRNLNTRARRFNILSKSSNSVEKEVKIISLEPLAKSDGWIHRSRSSLKSSDEVETISSQLATPKLSESSSVHLETKLGTLFDIGSKFIATGSSKFNVNNNSSGSSLRETQDVLQRQVTFSFAIHDFQLEMRVWRPLGAPSNLSNEIVILIKQCDKSLDFSQDEIITTRI